MKFGIGSIRRKNHQRIVALFLTLSMGMIAVHVDAQTDGKSKTTATKKQQGKTGADGKATADGKASADSKATTGGKTDDSTPFTSDNFIKDKTTHRQVNAYVKEFMSVDITVLDPRNVSDIFGRHLAHRYVVLQVTVKNDNPKFRFLIQDVKLQVDGIYVDPDLIPKVNLAQYYPSSNDLSLVQGVAERGQSYDRRNFTLRLLRGAGSIAAGLIGVTTFGSSYAPSIAVFNGPVISAFANVFPDSTINQLIRLNDRAYRANTLVPTQQSVVIAVFLDLAMLLPGKDLRKKFFDDPLSIRKQIDFRGAVAWVDGTFITDVFEEPTSVTDVSITNDQMIHFQDPKPVVHGTIIGHGLTGATLGLDNTEAKNLTVKVDGTPEPAKLEFTITSDNPVESETPLLFAVKKGEAVVHKSLAVSYTASSPTLSKLSPSEGAAGASVPVVLTGTGFNGFSKITFDPDVITYEITEVKSTSIKANFTIDAAATPGDVKVTVENQNPTLPQVFKVKPAATPKADTETGGGKTEPKNKPKANPAKKPKPKPAP